MLAASCVSAQTLELTPEQKEMAAIGNDFSFKFLQQIDRNEDKDWFVSPVSLQMLLNVILNGAQNATADEIAHTLGFEASDMQALNDFNRLLLDRFPKLDPATKLVIGNAVFINQIYPINKDYKKLVEEFYKAEVKNLDFKNKQGTLRTINGWCNKQTNGMIPQVLDDVEPEMFAYLLNALYFKGTWMSPFNKKWTKERPFHLDSGKETQVWMMEKEQKILKIAFGEGISSYFLCCPGADRESHLQKARQSMNVLLSDEASLLVVNSFAMALGWSISGTQQKKTEDDFRCFEHMLHFSAKIQKNVRDK